MATLNYSDLSYDSVTLTSSGAGTPSNTRYWYFKITSGSWDIGFYTSNKSTSGSYTFTSKLKSGTFYTAECRYGPDLEALRKWRNEGTTTGTYNGGSCSFTTYSYGDDSGTLVVSSDYGQITAYIKDFTERAYPRDLYYTFSSGSETVTSSVYCTPLYDSATKTTVSVTGGSTYTITVESWPPNAGTYSYCASTTKYVQGYDQTDRASFTVTPGVDSATIHLTSITSRSYKRTINITWKSTSTAEQTESITLPAHITTLDHIITGLESDTEYSGTITIKNPKYTTYSSTFSFKTGTYDYTMTCSTHSTYNTIGVKVTISPAQTYDVSFVVYLNNGNEMSDTIVAGSTSIDKTYRSDIEPATVYSIKVYDNQKKETHGPWNKRTKNNFSWSTNVEKGVEFNLTAEDWNEFTSQLKSKASYFGKTYSPATVSKGEYLTAEKFNNIVAVINWLVDNNKGDCVTRLDSVSQRGPIYASVINSLATCLNE